MPVATSCRTCSIPVNRFYDRYYFRPRVVWRIVRDALWDNHERKRLYHEAVDFLRLRADRKKIARDSVDKKALVSVRRVESHPRVEVTSESPSA